MRKDLIRNINYYTKDLKSKRDWQVSRVYKFENTFFKNEKGISVAEANKIVRKLERHWNMLITQVYPEYEEAHGGDSWPIGRKSSAINVYSTSLYPSVIVHEVSHGITECTKKFHSPNIRDPGHGALWCGVYVYNIKLITGLNIEQELLSRSIRVVDRATIQTFKEYFKND